MLESGAVIYAAAFLTGLPIGYVLQGSRVDAALKELAGLNSDFDAHANEALAVISCDCGGYMMNPERFTHTPRVCGPRAEF